MNKSQIAIITGVSLILMAIIAGFSVGYAFPEFYQPGKLDLLKSNITNNQGLYKSMLGGILTILILDLLVSFTLYKFFKKNNGKLSIISSALRVIYTIIFGIATFFLTKNINPTIITNHEMNTNIELFQSIWNGGLIVFGIHIFLVGILMNEHKRIPKILCYLTLIAGVSYIIVHLLKLTNFNSEFITKLEMILILPMTLGELGLAIWLIVKGGKATKLKQ